MTAECPPDLFKEFENSSGDWASPDDEGQQFLYDALGEHMEFTGLTSFTIPILDLQVEVQDLQEHLDHLDQYGDNIYIGAMLLIHGRLGLLI